MLRRAAGINGRVEDLCISGKTYQRTDWDAENFWIAAPAIWVRSKGEERMAKTFHMCIDVRGMLNWTRRETMRNLKNITKSDGTRYASVAEFRNSLMDELVRGHEVLPIGDLCEGFDFKKGCPGHV